MWDGARSSFFYLREYRALEHVLDCNSINSLDLIFAKGSSHLGSEQSVSLKEVNCFETNEAALLVVREPSKRSLVFKGNC